MSVSPRDEFCLEAKIKYSEMTEKSPPSFFNSWVSWVQTFNSTTAGAGHWDTTHKEQNHPEQRFLNEGLCAEREIWMATRSYTSPTLPWPWRAIRKMYAEAAHHSEQSFHCKYKSTRWRSLLPRGKSTSPLPNAAGQSQYHWMAQDCLSSPLKAVLQNLEDVGSGPSLFLQQPGHAPMPATCACKQKFAQNLPGPVGSSQHTPESLPEKL